MQYDISADATTGLPATITVADGLGPHSYTDWTNPLTGVVLRIHVAWHVGYAVTAGNGSVGKVGCETVSKPPPPPPP